MRILICGDRNWSNREVIKNYIYSLSIYTVIIEGEARGADTIAREIAEERGMTVLKYSAKWERYGNSAGPIRNSEMLKDGKPSMVVAFHDDLSKSKGTIDTLKKAHNKGIFCVVVDSNSRMVEFEP